MGEGDVEAGRAVLQYPAAAAADGPRPIAELIILGVAAGRSGLWFEGSPSGASLAQAVVDVR
jgi:hypothetical protein